MKMEGQMAPTAVARLLVQLPDKYPGQDLVFLATIASATARVTAVRTAGRWPIELSLDAGRTWPYRSAAALSRTTLGLLFRVGLAPTI
jgi:hypothetical protein